MIQHLSLFLNLVGLLEWSRILATPILKCGDVLRREEEEDPSGRGERAAHMISTLSDSSMPELGRKTSFDADPSYGLSLRYLI